MRNTIELYRPNHRGEMEDDAASLMIIFSVVGVVMLVVGLIGLFDPATPDFLELVLLLCVPSVLHYGLHLNSAYRGLTSEQSSLLSRYVRLPKEIKDNFRLPREEILNLSARECRNLIEKMDAAVRYRQREAGMVKSAHNYLDAVIEQYKPIER